MRTVAVVPSYEEEGSVGRTVGSLLTIPGVDEVVVVDDFSTDLSAREAAGAGATVVVNGANLGKGGSLNRVLPHLEFDTLLLVDGDLGDSAREAERILAPVLAGEADLAIAAFGPAKKKGGFGIAQGLGGMAIRLLAGGVMVSPLSGQRAMTRRTYERVAPFEEGFGVEVGMTVDALRAGLTVVEVETGMSHRETGRDLAGFKHRGRQFLDILSTSFHKYAGIRTPMHPHRLRSVPSKYYRSTCRSRALPERRIDALGASPYLWNAALRSALKRVLRGRN